MRVKLYDGKHPKDGPFNEVGFQNLLESVGLLLPPTDYSAESCYVASGDVTHVASAFT